MNLKNRIEALTHLLDKIGSVPEMEAMAGEGMPEEKESEELAPALAIEIDAEPVEGASEELESEGDDEELKRMFKGMKGAL